MWVELSSNFGHLSNIIQPLLRTNLLYEKPTVVFSPHTWGSRASHSRIMLTALRAFQKHPKTTVLQSKITTKTLLNSFSGHHKENKSRDIFCVLMFQHLLANTHYRLCDLKSQPRLGQVEVCIWLPTKLKMQDLLHLTMRLTVFSPLQS